MQYDNKRILNSIIELVDKVDKLDVDSELKKFLVDFSALPRHT